MPLLHPPLVNITMSGTSLGFRPPSNSGNLGSVPGWGTKIPHGWGQKSLCAATRQQRERQNEDPRSCSRELMQPNKHMNILKINKQRQPGQFKMESYLHLKYTVPSWLPSCFPRSGLSHSTPNQSPGRTRKHKWEVRTRWGSIFLYANTVCNGNHITQTPLGKKEVLKK